MHYQLDKAPYWYLKPGMGELSEGQVYDITKLYYDEIVLPKEAKMVFPDGTERPLYKHLTVFVKDRPGEMWIYDQEDLTGASRWRHIRHGVREFVDGKEAVDTGILLLSKEEAEAFAQRGGAFFFNGEKIFRKDNRFNPHIWEDYRGKGLGAIGEYFKILLTEDYKNSLTYNLYLEPFERGTLRPLVVVVGITVSLVTLLMPIFLLVTVYFLYLLHYRNIRTSRDIPAGTVSPEAPTSIRPEVRQMIYRMNPNLTLVMTDKILQYLQDLYDGRRGNVAQLKELFYGPIGTSARDQIEALPNQTIKEVIIRPILRLMAIIVTVEAQRTADYGSGYRSIEDGGYALVEDKLKDYIESRLDAGRDPFAEAPDADGRSVRIFTRIDIGIMELWQRFVTGVTWRETTNVNGTEEIRTHIASIIQPIKDYLENVEYRRRGLDIIRYPIARNKVFRYLRFHLIILPGLAWEIWRSRKDYRGNLTQDEIRQKKRFFRAYLGWWLASNIAMAVVSTIYSLGTMPAVLMSTLLSILVFAVTMRMALRTWWHLHIEAAAQARDRAEEWHYYKSYEDVRRDGDILRYLRDDAYLRQIYKEVVVEGTLRAHPVYVTSEESSQLLAVLNSGSLPELSNWMAKLILAEFFNKVRIYRKQGIAQIIEKQLALTDLKRLAFFITDASTSVLPTAKELDILEPSPDPGHGEVKLQKPTFTMIKEKYGDGWKIYITDLIQNLSGRDINSDPHLLALRDKLSNPELSFAQTVDDISAISGNRAGIEARIIKEWVVYYTWSPYRTLKTVFDSAYLTYKVLLRIKLGHEPSDDEMKKYLRFVYYYNYNTPQTKVSSKILTDDFINDPEHPWGYNDKNALGSIIDKNQSDGEHVQFKLCKLRAWAFGFPYVDDGSDDPGVVFYLDYFNALLPATSFLLPFDVYQFHQDQRLGGLNVQLEQWDHDITPTAADQNMAEDNWNTRIVPAEAIVSEHSNYGMGMYRVKALRGTGAYTSIIEDTTTGEEVLLKGYRFNYSGRVSLGRPREKTQHAMTSFNNRFDGPVIDALMSLRFRKVVKSALLHATEKLGLLLNYDFYPTNQLIPLYNILIFTVAFFLLFTPFKALAIPFFFINLQYIYTQAISSGAVGDKVARKGLARGWLAYERRFWSAVLTFVPLIAIGSHKANDALKGITGIFSRGKKETRYAIHSFEGLRKLYRPATVLGTILLVILHFAPLHPFGVAANIFFHAMAFALIFGPFMKNGYSRPMVSGSIFGGAVLAFIIHNFIIVIPSPFSWLAAGAFAAAVIIAGIKEEKYSKGIIYGIGAILYLTFVDLLRLTISIGIGIGVIYLGKYFSFTSFGLGGVLGILAGFVIYYFVIDFVIGLFKRIWRKEDTARPIPSQGMPTKEETKSEIERINWHGTQVTTVTDDAEEVRAAVYYLRSISENKMAEYLEYLAKAGRIRAGPFRRFLATTYVDNQGEEGIALSTYYPAYDNPTERSISLSHDIGATSKFKRSHSENEFRGEGFRIWHREDVTKQFKSTSLISYIVTLLAPTVLFLTGCLGGTNSTGGLDSYILAQPIIFSISCLLIVPIIGIFLGIVAPLLISAIIGMVAKTREILVRRAEEKLFLLNSPMFFPVIRVLKQKGITTEHLVKHAAPAAKEAIETHFSEEKRLRAINLVVDLALRIRRDADIPACSTIQYGVPLAARVSQNRLDWFEQNLQALEESAVKLQSVNPYEMLYYGKDAILKFGSTPEGFKKSLGAAKLIPEWFKQARDKSYSDVRLKEAVPKIIERASSIENLNETLLLEISHVGDKTESGSDITSDEAEEILRAENSCPLDAPYTVTIEDVINSRKVTCALPVSLESSSPVFSGLSANEKITKASSSSPISDGIDWREEEDLISWVIEKALHEGRVVALNEVVQAFVGKASDYYRNEGMPEAAEAISSAEIMVVLPEEHLIPDYPPFYVWYQSASKFILSASYQGRIYLPLEFMTVLIQKQNVPLRLIAKFIKHEVYIAKGMVIADRQRDREDILNELYPYLIRATIMRYGLEEKFLGSFYARGLLKQEPVKGNVASVERGDIPVLKNIGPEKRRYYISLAMDAVRRGLVATCILAGGASTRMDMKQLPAFLRELIFSGQVPYIPAPAIGENVVIPGKALVPAVNIGGRWHSFLSLFFVEQSALISRLDIQRASLPAILATNSEYFSRMTEYLGREGLLEFLEIMKYYGVMGKRVYAKWEDVQAALQKEFTKFFTNHETGEIDRQAVSAAYEYGLRMAAEGAGRVIEVGGKVIPAPRGHGGILHQLFIYGLILDLIQPTPERPQGIKYIFFRNVDNTTARLDEDWMVNLGLMIDEDKGIFIEVSRRPEGQSGGTAIKRLDIGNRIYGLRIAEDPSLRDTAINPKKAYYINNAVGIFTVDALTQIYDTSLHELRQISQIQYPGERKSRLIEVANRGIAKYPINPVPKVVRDVRGQALLGTAFETNMWESTGIDGIDKLVGMIETDSVSVLHDFIRERLGLPRDKPL
ncbi:hypothetical protein EPN16_06605, partial [bacterium]